MLLQTYCKHHLGAWASVMSDEEERGEQIISLFKIVSCMASSDFVDFLEEDRNPVCTSPLVFAIPRSSVVTIGGTEKTGCVSLRDMYRMPGSFVHFRMPRLRLQIDAILTGLHRPPPASLHPATGGPPCG